VFVRATILATAIVCGQLTFGQIGPLSLGAKVGIPISDALAFKAPDTCAATAAVCGIINYSSKTKRFTFGPSGELRLPYGLGVEFDALYTRLNYDSYFFRRAPSSGHGSAFTSTRADRWNFPILMKWRHDVHRITPFIDGGIAFDHISGVRSNFASFNQDFSGFVSSLNGTTSNAVEFIKPTSEGFVAGGGMDFRTVRRLHMMPEFRYTRWFSENFDREPGAIFHTNQNETTFLLGIAF
jgi:opacity protein-like surface antigen